MLTTVCAAILPALLAQSFAVPFAVSGRVVLNREAPPPSDSETRGIAADEDVSTFPDEPMPMPPPRFWESPSVVFLPTSEPRPYVEGAATLFTTSGPDFVARGIASLAESLQVARSNATPVPITAQLGMPHSTLVITTPISLEESDNEVAQDDDVEDAADAEDRASLLQMIKTQLHLFLACVPRWGTISCIKLEALLLLHGESGGSLDGFLDGLSSSQSRHDSLAARLSAEPTRRDDILNRMLLGAVHDLLEDTLSREQGLRSTGRRRRKGQGWSNPLVALMLGLGALIIVAGIGKTALVAGKALAVSTLALVIALVVGLRGAGGSRGGGGGGGFGNYEILATGLRRRAGSGDAILGGHLYIDPEPDHTQAYSAHHTRP